MSIFKCPECGKEISTQAAMCPGCGAPVENKTIAGSLRQIAKITALAAIAALALIVVLSPAKNDSPDGMAPPPNAPIEAPKTCRADYTLCADNKQVIEEFSGVRAARRACEKKLSELESVDNQRS